MKNISKAVNMALAVSLLAATPVWAAKKEKHQEAAESKISQYGKVQSKWQSFIEEGKKEDGHKSAAKNKTKSVSPDKLPSEMKSALRKIQSILPELKDLKLQSVNIGSGGISKVETWDFRFDKRNKGTKRNVYASVRYLPETGQIIRYNMQNSEWKTDKTISEEKAKEAASEFLKKVLGTMGKDYRFVEISSYVDRDDEEDEDDEERKQAFLTYQLVVNDIPVQDFTLGVLIDAEGRVLEYQNNRPEKINKSKFPSPKKAMEKDKAEDIFLDKLDMKLQYWLKSTHDEKGTPALGYTPSFTNPIDAQTGDEVDVTYRVGFEPKRVEVSGKGKPFAARSRQEAEGLLTMLGIDLGKWEFQENEDEDDFIFYRWTYKGDDEDGSISLLVDKSSGKVQRFSQRLYGNEKEPVISEKEALKTAIAGLETFLPSSTDELYLSDREGPIDQYNIPSWVDRDELPDDFDDADWIDYYFYFEDLYDDIPIKADAYMVSVDARTGLVRSLTLTPPSLHSMPDKDKAPSPKEAAKAYIKAHPVKLSYVWPEFFGQSAPAPTLVYDIADAAFFDANSSKKASRKKK